MEVGSVLAETETASVQKPKEMWGLWHAFAEKKWASASESWAAHISPVHLTYLGCRFGSELAELHPSGKGYTFPLVWSLFSEGARAKLCQAEDWIRPLPVLLNGANQCAAAIIC